MGQKFVDQRVTLHLGLGTAGLLHPTLHGFFYLSLRQQRKKGDFSNQ